MRTRFSQRTRPSNALSSIGNGQLVKATILRESSWATTITMVSARKWTTRWPSAATDKPKRPTVLKPSSTWATCTSKVSASNRYAQPISPPSPLPFLWLHRFFSFVGPAFGQAILRPGSGNQCGCLRTGVAGLDECRDTLCLAATERDI